MITFEYTGDYTKETAKIAVEKANELNTDIVISSTTGASAKVFYDCAKALDFKGKLVVVTHVYSNGKNEFDEEIRKELAADGVEFVTAAHALSAGERGISSMKQGMYPLEVIAYTLRCFSQGTKVCFECSVMALDAGKVPYNVPVVACGGTGRGLDTALVITPSYSASIFKTVINDFLCKPYVLK